MARDRSEVASAGSRRRRPRVAVLLAALVVALLAGVVWYLGPIAPIATGYAATTLCSGVFVSDRDPADVAGDLPNNPLVPFLRTHVDRSDASVRVTLLGAWRSTAFHTEGLGCTLDDTDPRERDPRTFAALDPLPPTDLTVPWPVGEGQAELPEGVDAEAVAAAIDLAFVEDDADGRLRNTRAVVVVHDGQLIAERYGEGFDADTPLLGWSMGKSMANVLIGRLVGDGRLALEDAALRPEWTDERAAITLEQLLAMTSGLAFEEVYDPGTDATRMLFRPGDTAGYAASLPLAHPPGTVWSYSSGTTNILCDLAHEASGLGPELARELLFAPLGMTSAVLEPDRTGTVICSSFPYATARDWARFGQLWLDDGIWQGERLLPEGWVEASSRPIDLDTGDTPYGWQWWLNDDGRGTVRMPSVPRDAVWASGNEGQQVVVIPSERLVVVRLGFSGAFSGVDWGLEPVLAGVIDALG